MRFLEGGSKMGDTDGDERSESVRDEGAVTVRGIGLEAQKTRASGAHDVRECLERRLGRRGLQMGAVDPPHLRVAAGTGGGATRGRSAEIPEMQVVDAGALDVGGQGGFGESRSA